MVAHGEIRYFQLQKLEIRLIDVLSGKPSDPIRCVLRATSLDENAKYEAVSYTWGPRTSFDRTLWINARPCRVRPNVFNTIHALRDERLVRTLWIDGLCINQNDNWEKTRQVRLMDRIYNGAKRVLLCLGPAEADSDAVFDFIEKLRQSTVDAATVSAPSIDTMHKAIKALCQRDYWSRAWIRQELVLAKEIEVCCGNRTAEWNGFATTCSVHFWEAVCNTPAHSLLQHRSQYLRNESQTLCELLLRYGWAQCFDPRDRVYSLLSLASDCAEGKGIQANYSLSPSDLFQKAISHCQPPDPAKFIGVLCNVTYPERPCLERLPCPKTLTAVLASVSRQSQAKAFHVRYRFDEKKQYDHHLEYVALKIRLVWHVIAIGCPTEPTRFNSVYRGGWETYITPAGQVFEGPNVIDPDDGDQTVNAENLDNSGANGATCNDREYRGTSRHRCFRYSH